MIFNEEKNITRVKTRGGSRLLKQPGPAVGATGELLLTECH